MRMRNPAPLPGGADINRKLLISGHIPVMIVPTNEPQTPRNFVLCTSILIRNTGTLYRSRYIYLFSPKAKYLSTFLKTFFPAVVTTSVMDLDSNWIHIQQLWGSGSVFGLQIWICTIKNKKGGTKIHHLNSELCVRAFFCSIPVP